MKESKRDMSEEQRGENRGQMDQRRRDDGYGHREERELEEEEEQVEQQAEERREQVDEQRDEVRDRSDGEQRLRLGDSRGNVNDVQDINLLREMEFLRRENDLMRRETEILKREQELLTISLRNNNTNTLNDRNNLNSISNGVQTIKDLLPEFDANDYTFWKWKQQLELIIENFNLNDNQTRILMSSRLKGRALNWFHSRPEHLLMSISNLLIEMKNMFDLRPGKVTLRREFENRKWNVNESFPNYFHDKLILANRVRIQEDELVDYIIDGIADEELRDYARIMNFKTKLDLLRSFEKLNMRPKKMYNLCATKINYNQNLKNEFDNQNEIVCFRCREVGHIALRCTNEKKITAVECYQCHETGHFARDCPRRSNEQWSKNNKKSNTSTSDQNSTLSTSSATRTSVNTIFSLRVSSKSSDCASENEAFILPYMVNMNFSYDNKNNELCVSNLNAMVDSGSPISLIKECFVPKYLCKPLKENVDQFHGMNGSPLEISRIFEHEVEVENIPLFLKFYIVSNHAMDCTAILGRDFISNSNIEVNLDENTVTIKQVSIRESHNDGLRIDQILPISCDNEQDYLDSLKTDSMCDEEKINLDNFEEEEFGQEFEMKTILEEPISFHQYFTSTEKKDERQVTISELNRALTRKSYKLDKISMRVAFRYSNTKRDYFQIQLTYDNRDYVRDKNLLKTIELTIRYCNVKIFLDDILVRIAAIKLIYKVLRGYFRLYSRPKKKKKKSIRISPSS